MINFHNVRNHLKTINRHHMLVMKYCFKCGLYKQGILHDLSKYTPSEFIPSVQYYQGYRSPYIYEKELKGYSTGWLHHKGRNKHHWEYWYDYINGSFQPIEMPLNYLVESVCDRIAASRVYYKDNYTNDRPLKYFMATHAKDFMHPKSGQLLEDILIYLKENGEEKTFQLLRELLKEKKSEL